jgi:hypothetical protein
MKTEFPQDQLEGRKPSLLIYGDTPDYQTAWLLIRFDRYFLFPAVEQVRR